MANPDQKQHKCIQRCSLQHEVQSRVKYTILLTMMRVICVCKIVAQNLAVNSYHTLSLKIAAHLSLIFLGLILSSFRYTSSVLLSQPPDYHFSCSSRLKIRSALPSMSFSKDKAVILQVVNTSVSNPSKQKHSMVAVQFQEQSPRAVVLTRPL